MKYDGQHERNSLNTSLQWNPSRRRTGKMRQLSSNQVVKDALAVAIADVKRGQTISGSLSTRRAIPKMVSAMIRIGEETGRLPFLLEKLLSFIHVRLNLPSQLSPRRWSL